eukprot:3385106-Pyramimonas_sp.AAC.1
MHRSSHPLRCAMRVNGAVCGVSREDGVAIFTDLSFQAAVGDGDDKLKVNTHTQRGVAVLRSHIEVGLPRGKRCALGWDSDDGLVGGAMWNAYHNPGQHKTILFMHSFAGNT